VDAPSRNRSRAGSLTGFHAGCPIHALYAGHPVPSLTRNARGGGEPDGDHDGCDERDAQWQAGDSAARSGVVLFYVAIRLVFLYGDSGALPDGTALSCQIGPDCTYARYVASGQAEELAALGISDGKSLEAAAWRELTATGLGLFALTMGGALIGGFGRSLATQPGDDAKPRPLETTPERTV